MHPEYDHEMLSRSKRTCNDRYRLAAIAPFFKSQPDTMHLRCISRCTTTKNCKYCFVQNEKDGIKNGKCQLYSHCDKLQTSVKRGRLYVIRIRTTTTAKPTTTTTTNETTSASTTTTIAATTTPFIGKNAV